MEITNNRLKYWDSLRGGNLSEEHKTKIKNTLTEGFRNGRIKKQEYEFGDKANNWQGGLSLNKICPDCRKEMNHRAERCRSCFLKNSPMGEDSPNWRGGKTGKIKLIRNSREYLKWREAVFIRDDFTCKDCGKRGCYLHAHHIKQAAFYPELMLDVNNGVTLCKKCHKEVPVIYNKNKFSVDQA